MFTRRNFLKTSSTLAGMGLVSPEIMPKKQKYHIGACDWSINGACSVGVFDTAQKIGLEGVQISYNSKNDEAWLSKPSVQAEYLAASKQTGVKIASIGIARLNEVPYKSEARTNQWVSDAITAAKALGVRDVLLAFFAKNDLRNDAPGKKVVIDKLREMAPQAEKMGINLAIESYLSAEENLDIIQAVGSKAVTVYYDFRNSTDAGYDIYREIPMLKNYITEIHMKENGVLLGKGSLDWPRIAQALRDIDYTGWMQIEWAMENGADTLGSYRQNLAFLKGLFA